MEWDYLPKQETASNMLELEKQQRKLRERSEYNKSLQYQVYLKQLNLQEQNLEKARENRRLRHTETAHLHQEETKRLQESALKRLIADDYKAHSVILRQKAQEERAKEIHQEQQAMQELRKHIEREEKKKALQKKELAMQQQIMLQHRQEIENKKKMQLAHQQKVERDLVNDRKLREDRKEQDYRNYYQRTYQQKPVYSPKKALEPIEGPPTTYRVVEPRIVKNNLAESLRFQMQEKERQKISQKVEVLREREDIARRNEMASKLQAENDRQRWLQMKSYKNELFGQLSLQNKWNHGKTESDPYLYAYKNCIRY